MTKIFWLQLLNVLSHLTPSVRTFGLFRTKNYSYETSPGQQELVLVQIKLIGSVCV